MDLQLMLQRLAGLVARDLGHEVDRARPLVGGQLVGDELQQLVLAHRTALDTFDHRLDLFAPLGVGDAEDELLQFVSDRLAGYKRPRSIDLVAEIPRNQAGKPLKHQLRAPYWKATGQTI